MAGAIVNNLTYQIFYILSGAWRRRYLILIPTLLLPIAGFLIGTMIPKKYVSHTSMLIQETAKMNPFLEDLAVSTMIKERMGALQTLLHSRHILGKVAEEQELINDTTPPAQADEIIDQLSNSLTMEMASKDLISIEYTAASPDGMQEMLETVSRQLINQLLAPERSSMQDSSHFLAEHLKFHRQALEKAETALANYRDEHANELPELHLTNMNRLAELRQRLNEREAELAGAKKNLGSIDQQLSRTNPIVGRIEQQIIQIREELVILRARYTDSHSKIQAALRNLERLQEERKKLLEQTGQNFDFQQLWDIVSSDAGVENTTGQLLLVSQLETLQEARNRFNSLQEETESLKTIIAELEQQTAGYGVHQRELTSLERDLKVRQSLYNELLQRYEMARLTGSLGIFEQDKRIKVIDRPFTPSSPSNLPPIIFAIAGLFGGLFLGCGMALVFELTDTTLRRRDRLEQLTGVPVLGRVAPLTPTTPITTTSLVPTSPIPTTLTMPTPPAISKTRRITKGE